MSEYITGIVADMPNADYHALPHMSSSGFKLMALSPRHWWTASGLNPEREKKEASRIMVMGTAWHTGVFENHLFASTYAAKPDVHPSSTLYALLQAALEDWPAWKAKHVALPEGLGKTTKDGKALLAELEAKGQVGVAHEVHAQVLELVPGLLGKVLLSADDLDAVRAMVAAAHSNAVTRVVLQQPGGMAEHSIFWIDEQTGAPCRIRPDYMLPPSAMFPTGLIIDGKSTHDASPEGFGRTAWENELYWQAAFYCDGYQQHFGTSEPPVFAWLAQERDAPFECKYHSAPADFIAYGRRRYRPLLARFAECLSTGDFPGYPGGVAPLQLPAYAARAIDAAA